MVVLIHHPMVSTKTSSYRFWQKKKPLWINSRWEVYYLNMFTVIDVTFVNRQRCLHLQQTTHSSAILLLPPRCPHRPHLLQQWTYSLSRPINRNWRRLTISSNCQTPSQMLSPNPSLWLIIHPSYLHSRTTFGWRMGMVSEELICTCYSKDQNLYIV